MPVPMLDLKAQYAQIKHEIDAAVAEVFATQQFRDGPVVEAFEARMAAYLGAAYGVAVASGTDALLLMLRAAGVQPGDEVITSPFSFFATAGAIVNVGALPVFVDIDPVTFNLNPAAIEEAITEKTRAILPVHVFGQCADMDPILRIGRKHGLVVVEDAAQAVGAKYKGRHACTLGVAGALSFYPTKNLGAAGEGGMVITNSEKVAKAVRLLRCHGSVTQYHHDEVGVNSHLHAVQAAVLGVKLPYLDGWNARRREVCAYYTENLEGLPGVVLPKVADHAESVWHQYVIRLRHRDEALTVLRERGIGCGVFYPKPLHRQDCFAHLDCHRAYCPEADRACAEVLALPVFAELTFDQQDEVISAVRDHVAGAVAGAVS